MIKQIILAFFASISPAILFNYDKKKLFWAGFSGVLGWASYLLVYGYTKSPVVSSFFGTFVLGVYSELMARILKTPATEISIPGIFPLVPGITAYNTIGFIVKHNYSAAYTTGMLTVAVGGAIAFGLMLSSTTYRLISKISEMAKKRKHH